MKELISFREFQAKTESKLDKLENSLFTSKSENANENVDDNADLVISLLKSRINSLESELYKNNGIMEILSEQLVYALKGNLETVLIVTRSHKLIKWIIDVKVNRFPGGMGEIVLDEIDALVGQKPDCVIVHARC